MKRDNIKQQNGIFLIELMVGMALALFLMLGLYTLFSNISLTHRSQSSLSVLQERQRLAFSVMANVIRSAGYFSVPSTQPKNGDPQAIRTSRLPADQYYAEGISIAGTEGGQSPDQIRIRFRASGEEPLAVFNCNGTSNNEKVDKLFDNVFSIVERDGTRWLTCTVRVNDADAGPTQYLVDGIEHLDVQYGIDTSDSGSVSQYVNASTVPDWNKVRSIRITLTFSNPLGQDTGNKSVQANKIIQVTGNT